MMLPPTEPSPPSEPSPPAEPSPLAEPDPWVALTIGNSRCHWAYFRAQQLTQVWTVPHLVPTGASPPQTWQDWWRLSPALQHHHQRRGGEFPALWLASVVPAQTQVWQSYPQLRCLTLGDIPLQQRYATLGLDRALAVWAAGSVYGWPVLVIDAGTALTFTGADATATLVGGAILPGLGLQLQSLTAGTATLPPLELPTQLPHRWAQETPTAIHSGILYTLVAGLYDFVDAWRQQFPTGRLCITGGDQAILTHALQAWCTHKAVSPEWMQVWVQDPQLLFRGMQLLRAQLVSHPGEPN